MRLAPPEVVKRRLGIVILALLAGCAAPTTEETDDGTSEAAQTGTGGYVYFHGMSHLGFARSDLKNEVGSDSLVTPSLSDAQLQADPPKVVVDFLAGREGATVAGYSLGRLPVLRLMKASAKGMTHAVLVDPTYDSSAVLGRGVGGSVAKEWLDADESRTFLLVYGDVTKEVGGDKSYLAELADHPRAQLCYVPGDHARFRAADMTAALVVKTCAELDEKLGR